MKLTRVLILLLLSCSDARAGAWTQAEDRLQVITNAIYSDAERAFDSRSSAQRPVTFQRLLIQTSADYGWNDDLTFFGRVETANARFANEGAPPAAALNTALEAGARYLLLNDPQYGVLSLQGSLRTAGAFNFAISANSLVSGRSAGLRVLYGFNFQWHGLTGFADIQAGHTFLSRPRPNETPFDLTAGLWLNEKTMAMLQSFNLVGEGGGGGNAYPYFRSHKIQASLVRVLSPRYSLLAGAFFSPAGQNALVERGLCVSLWAHF